jgi:hypothetical protein
MIDGINAFLSDRNLAKEDESKRLPGICALITLGFHLVVTACFMYLASRSDFKPNCDGKPELTGESESSAQHVEL